MSILPVILVVAELIAMGSTSASDCPPGFISSPMDPAGDSSSSNSSSCVCANEVPAMEDYVVCDSTTAQLLDCYCISNETNGVFIGPCIYGCFLSPRSLYYTLSSSYDEVNDLVCSRLKRKGRFCAECALNHSHPVYSYTLKCVQCNDETQKYTWLRYIIVAYLPLTVFLFIVIFCRISVTKPPLEIFVLICQLLMSHIQLRPIQLLLEEDKFFTSKDLHNFLNNIFKVSTTCFGIWNLDFFRALYPPFCLNERATLLNIFALEYGVALYPLALIIVMYTCVKLHSRGCRIIHYIWRPFHFCLARFRRQFDIQSSLIDSFATFLALSYLKFSTVSVDILIPVTLHNITGKGQLHTVFYQPDTMIFHNTHLFLAIFAIFAFVTFTIVPALLLCLYPCLQKYISAHWFTGRLLYTFMDTFQGHYKNGTNGTKDCRSFSAVYVILRIFLVFAYSCTLSINFYPIAVGLVILTALLVAVVQPYKYQPYNAVHTFLLIVLGLMYLSLYSLNDAMLRPNYQIALSVFAFLGSIIYIYIAMLVMFGTFSRDTYFWRLCGQCSRMLHEAEECGTQDREREEGDRAPGRRVDEHTSLIQVTY